MSKYNTLIGLLLSFYTETSIRAPRENHLDYQALQGVHQLAAVCEH